MFSIFSNPYSYYWFILYVFSFERNVNERYLAIYKTIMIFVYVFFS
jgi:hypothetical protein